MPSLLAYPREVRDMIYINTLVIPTPITPYPADHELCLHPDAQITTVTPKGRRRLQKLRAQRPSTALLRVNKMISAEVRPILYGKNHWRLTGILPSINIFSSYSQLFRRITLVFDQRHIDKKLEDHMFDINHKGMERARATHGQCLKEIMRVPQWTKLLCEMVNFLEYIHLDLKEFNCPGDRPRISVFEKGGLFYQYFLAYLTPKKLTECRGDRAPTVSITGLQNDYNYYDNDDEERELIYDTFGFVVPVIEGTEAEVY